MAPPAIPAIITAVSAYAFAHVSITTAIFIGVTQLALGFAARLLAPKPKSSATSTADAVRKDRSTSFRQAITARSWVYGEKRNGGPIVFIKSENQNEKLHMVIPVSGARVRRIRAVFLNEEPLHTFDLDVGGTDLAVIGRYKDRVRVMFHTGTDSQVANNRLVATFGGWTENHKLSGTAYVYIMLKWKAELFSSIPAMSCWIQGKMVEEIRDSARPTLFTKNPALILRDYMITPIDRGGFGAKEEDIDEDSFITAANICDEFVDVDQESVTAFTVVASSNAIHFTEEICPFASGDKVQIRSSGNMPGGLDPDTFYYVGQARPFGITYNEGPVGESRSSRTAINLFSDYESALDGSNVNVVDMTTNGSGTIRVVKFGEPRYTSDGIIDTDREPVDIMEDILSSMAGRMAFVGGKWRLFAGAYEAATKTLTEEDLRAPISIQTKHSRKDRFNAVKGIFSSFLTKDVATSYPVVKNDFYKSQDGGDQLFAELDFPFTARPIMAQRLAKIALERHRQEITVTFPAKLTAFDLAVGVNVALTLERYGWVAKEFEVVNWRLVTDEDGEGNPIFGVDLILRETAAGVFDWNMGEETKYDLAPDTDLPNAFNVAAPTNLVLESGDDTLDVRRDGTVFSRIKVSWNLPNDFYVQDGGQIEIWFKRSSLPNTPNSWNKNFRVPGNSTFAYILDVKDNELYDVAIRSINFLGRYSDEDKNPGDWETVSFNHLVIGKKAKPPAPDSFAVVRLGDGTRRFEWTQDNTQDDVRAGGGAKIRYQVGTGGFWEGMTELHEGIITNSPYEINEPAAGTYTFAIKSQDSSENESESALFYEATLGPPRLRNIIHSQDEYSLGWPGVKTDCFVDLDGFLSPHSAGDWDDLPATWDGLAVDWLSLLPNVDPFVYTTEEIDLGVNAAFTPLVTIDGVGAATITMQVGMQADGGAVGSFVPLDPVSGVRYVKIRVSMAGDPALLRNVTIFLDGETQTEEYSDLDTSDSANGPPEFERLATGHFKLATRGRTAFIVTAQITAFVNAGSGWTWEVINKNTFIDSGTPAAEFKLYQNGTPADAVIDAVIKGPKS